MFFINCGNTCFWRASAFASVSDKLKLSESDRKGANIQNDDDDGGDGYDNY